MFSRVFKRFFHLKTFFISVLNVFYSCTNLTGTYPKHSRANLSGKTRLKKLFIYQKSKTAFLQTNTNNNPDFFVVICFQIVFNLVL